MVTGSGFNAEVYRRASLERMRTAQQLFRNRDYVMAAYVAGLAVECILRAYRFRLNPQFEGRHDLRRLAEESRFLTFVPEALRGTARAALGDLATRWSNDHRYRSSDALRQFLNAAGLFRLTGGRTVRGNVVRYNAEIVIDAMEMLVTIGDRRWKSTARG